jgi:hypothetical protein
MAQTFGMIAKYGQLKEKIDKETTTLQGNPKKTKQAASSQKQRNFESKRRTRTNLQQTSQVLLPLRRKPLKANI